MDKLDAEVKELAQEVEAFIKASIERGGYAITPPGDYRSRLARQAMRLLFRRASLENKVGKFSLQELDARWKSGILHFTVANPFRFGAAFKLLMEDPDCHVPWWYSLRNQCDLLAISSLARGDLKNLALLKKHMRWCSDCRKFYEDTKALLET